MYNVDFKLKEKYNKNNVFLNRVRYAMEYILKLPLMGQELGHKGDR